MIIDILTTFPWMIEPIIESSILKIASEKEIVVFNVIDIREYSKNKHKNTDDAPFGGGEGMIMSPQPLFDTIIDVQDGLEKIIFPTPDGIIFDQVMAKKLSNEKHLVFVCGHYKGIDQRVRDNFKMEEISIGDFVLTGGEIPTLAMVDSIVRLIPGVINNIKSAESDSFSQPLLDCPWYTRPDSYEGNKVPEVLLGGNHKKIDEWRQSKREEKTKKLRPDLWKKYIEMEYISQDNTKEQEFKINKKSN
ncbi:MAG: tRNA (guanosine(37)-N1)-methyltransferase TrmD [Candidatus Marinimicrobia bacterium]|nr:tRNA (guanosine(37)-N1)-methyltransferase TrmD [Candidatus Neomarinimicrobiota bacterium]